MDSTFSHHRSAVHNIAHCFSREWTEWKQAGLTSKNALVYRSVAGVESRMKAGEKRREGQRWSHRIDHASSRMWYRR